MTDPERTAWLALYAVAWFQPTGDAPGVLSCERRAWIAAERADVALEALKRARPEVLR
jgi:hypothetical protein